MFNTQDVLALKFVNLRFYANIEDVLKTKISEDDIKRHKK